VNEYCEEHVICNLCNYRGLQVQLKAAHKKMTDLRDARAGAHQKMSSFH